MMKYYHFSICVTMYVLYAIPYLCIFMPICAVSALLLVSPSAAGLSLLCSSASVPLAPDRNMSSDTHILLYKSMTYRDDSVRGQFTWRINFLVM